MSVRWFLAKYVPDRRRNEPINVGLILECDGEILYRFRAEEGGEINEHRARGFAKSARNYKAWYRYWKRQIQNVKSKGGSVQSLVEGKNGGVESYYLDVGGERVYGDIDNVEAFAASLYRELVDEGVYPGEEMTPDDLTKEQIREAPLGEINEWVYEARKEMGLKTLTTPDGQIPYSTRWCAAGPLLEELSDTCVDDWKTGYSQRREHWYCESPAWDVVYGKTAPEAIARAWLLAWSEGLLEVGE